jgi:4-amino-4-deoxy-L-arabinose transferase-like glycosyltransferase
MSTYLNGQPRHDKPILSYWLQAASLQGVRRERICLPPAVGAGGDGLWTLLVFGFGRRVADAAGGCWRPC